MSVGPPRAALGIQPAIAEAKAPPLAQAEQEEPPPYENEEAEHAEQVAAVPVLEFSGPTWPGMHGTPLHACAATLPAHCPDEQSEHEDAPASENVPRAHGEQEAPAALSAPAGAKVPAAQMVPEQAKFAVPALYVPGAQRRHDRLSAAA